MDLWKKYSEWEKLGSWNQIGVFAGIIGVVLSVLSLGGIQLTHLTELSLLVLSFGFLFLVYGNIQQSKELASKKDELDKVDSRIGQATALVYAQKKEEIDGLDLKLASWKDRSSNLQEKINSLSKERDNFKTSTEELQGLVQEERSRADKQIKESRAYIDNVMNCDRELFKIEKSKLTEALKIEEEKANQSEKDFDLMKYAYDKLGEEYNELIGKRVLKAESGNYKLTGNETNLEKLTVEYRMKEGDLTHAEAYVIAASKK